MGVRIFKKQSTLRGALSKCLQSVGIEEARKRAEEARRLIQHPLLRGAFDKTRVDLAEKIFQTKPDDPETREQIYTAHLVLDQIWNNLEQNIQYFEVMMAEGEINQMQNQHK